MTAEAASAGAGISLRGMVKTYGSTVALAGLDLDLHPGEVLGIAGPNGAGKSTLVRLIAGEERPTAGTATFDGRPWSPSEKWQAVAVVHQEPQLFPNLTVAENMMVGREGVRQGRPKLSAADAGVMETLGILQLKDKLLEDCSLATQQRTEIARAVARDCKVFLFDEPNSALTSEESDELFGLMHSLAGSGRIVVLVTHRLADLVAHCDRVVVVRDGRIHSELSGDAITADAIARRLVTENAAVLTEHRRLRDSASQVPALRLSNWTHARGAFADISFEARGGKIIALMGVEGSGARELLRSLGNIERVSGSISLGPHSGQSLPEFATAYVPATRQQSLYSNFSVGENLLVRLGVPQIAGRGGLLKTRRMAEIAADGVKRFMVKAQGPGQPIRALSGGNQQKVAIAQALIKAPLLLLLEEPTRGVDLHSKAEIYRLLRAYADAGNVVVIFCTEVLEIFEAADLAYVVAGGSLSPPLSIVGYDKVDELASAITALDQSHVPSAESTAVQRILS